MAKTNSVSANIRKPVKRNHSENRHSWNFTDMNSPNVLIKMLHTMTMDVYRTCLFGLASQKDKMSVPAVTSAGTVMREV